VSGRRDILSFMRASLLFLGIASFGCGSVVDKGQHDAAVSGDGRTPDGVMVDAAPTIDAYQGPQPRLWWKFEGNTNNSGSVNGFALATPAGISYVAAKVGMGVSFSSSQYANVTGMKNVLGMYGAVTIAFWLKEPGNVNGVAMWDDINRTASPYGGVQIGLSNNTVSLCVSTTSNSLLSGSCGGPGEPVANTFHHWIIRYNGTGTSAGQGGVTEIYVDDVLVYTRANDSANNPVFTTAISDTMTIGVPNGVMDDLRIYDQVFTQAEQCTYIIGGAYAGTTCTLP